MSIEVLKTEIVTAFRDKWEINDAAHRQPHFEAVFQTGLVLNERLGLGFDPKLILYTAYFHDLFAWSRVNHHELSYQWMLTTDHPVIQQHLTSEEIEVVAWACRQHRASFKGEFETKFCELMNAADRELPQSVDQLLERARLYRLHNHPTMSEEEILQDSIAHIKGKFGHNGYARYPQLYLDCFASELSELRRQIAQL